MLRRRICFLFIFIIFLLFFNLFIYLLLVFKNHAYYYLKVRKAFASPNDPMRHLSLLTKSLWRAIIIYVNTMTSMGP